MATIMLIEFCRMFGMGYLNSTLKSLVTRVCQHPGTIEVPSRHSCFLSFFFSFIIKYCFVIYFVKIIFSTFFF